MTGAGNFKHDILFMSICLLSAFSGGFSAVFVVFSGGFSVFSVFSMFSGVFSVVKGLTNYHNRQI
jgi:hypothetical protein